MIIVDTTVWVDYLRGASTPQTEWLDANLERERIGLTDLILCEVLQGIKDDEMFRAVQRALLKFEVFPSGGIELAIAAAKNYRRLRAKGLTVRRTIDCVIATFCLEHGHSLLHNDRDFDLFEHILGLVVIRPSCSAGADR
ncbi:MAG: PIN domain nuclease [Nitrospira sp.]|nr:PIN domain nuclease [Nitrospira sp.]